MLEILPDRREARHYILSRLCRTLGSHIAAGWSTNCDEGWGRAVSRALRGRTGDVMAFDTTVADRLLLRRRIGWSERATLVLAAIAVALGAATWTVEPDQTGAFATAALPARSDSLSFEDRFVPISRPPSLGGDSRAAAAGRRGQGRDAGAGCQGSAYPAVGIPGLAHRLCR